MASLDSRLLLPLLPRQVSSKALLGLPCSWKGKATSSYPWKASSMAAGSSRRRKRTPSVKLGVAGRGGRRRRALAFGVLRRIRLRVLVVLRVLRRVQRRVGYYFSVPAAMPGAVAYIR